jgi:hypothetical protein
MNKFYLTLLLALSVVAMQAQSLSPTVIASSGGFTSNGAGMLSYTVGEMTMVQTFSVNNNILTQGFQQPNDNLTGILDMTQDEFGSFAIYPNPAVDNTWYGFQLPEAGKVSISMYDALGQKLAEVYNANYTTGKITEQTNLSTFAAGMYYMTMTFISVKDGKAHLQTKKFQIIR